ncbi:50S ribosomal protein L17 [Candidatus Shapirobacteria bacterium]|nr:50S ribosomal protein L17 [Candidatus Shapirobacteria bacterium]
MRHRKKKQQLGRDYDHRRSVKKNLVRSLFLHGRIETTLTKAKAIIPLAERIIARIKKNNLSGRRYAFSLFNDQEFVNQIATQLLPRFKDNQGGIIRLRRIKRRKGDNALLVALELVDKKGGIKKEKEEKK